MDRINEAEFKSATKSPGGQQQQTSFLWTIGPRPFWELWPHKKHKKKKLNLDEFIQCLLEQWARTHQYPPELAAEIVLKKDQGPPATTKAQFNNHKMYICKKFNIYTYLRFCIYSSQFRPHISSVKPFISIRFKYFHLF